MPKVVIRHNPELAIDDIVASFAKNFEGKYEVSRIRFGRVAIKKSWVTGVAVSLVQKERETALQFGGFTPTLRGTIISAGLIPILILNATSWKTLVNEVKDYIESEPSFQ